MSPRNASTASTCFPHNTEILLIKSIRKINHVLIENVMKAQRSKLRLTPQKGGSDLKSLLVREN